MVSSLSFHLQLKVLNLKFNIPFREFPGDSVVSTWHFHCQGLGSIPDCLIGELRSYKPQSTTKKIKIKIPFKQLTFFPPLILLQWSLTVYKRHINLGGSVGDFVFLVAPRGMQNLPWLGIRPVPPTLGVCSF